MPDAAPVVIQGPWEGEPSVEPTPVPIDRHSIVKRRWRRPAADGTELVYQLPQASKKIQENAQDL